MDDTDGWKPYSELNQCRKGDRIEVKSDNGTLLKGSFIQAVAYNGIQTLEIRISSRRKAEIPYLPGRVWRYERKMD